MKLLLDMNLSPRWCSVFKSPTFEALHWSQIGPVTAHDTEILAYARQNNFIVLTNDLDFTTILAVTHGDKPSVVQLRSINLNPNIIGKTVCDALIQMKKELEEGALLTIDANRSRLRLLPLLKSDQINL